MRQVLWTCVAVWIEGCEIPASVKSEIACTTVCTCFVPGTQVKECIDECIQDGDLGNVPDDCFECIQSHANQCSMLETDCEPLCEMEEPPQGFPDAGLPDAALQDGGP